MPSERAGETPATRRPTRGEPNSRKQKLKNSDKAPLKWSLSTQSEYYSGAQPFRMIIRLRSYSRSQILRGVPESYLAGMFRFPCNSASFS